jgi:hypothetical protein
MLLRCYPPSWRDRYGDEFLGLLDETGLGGREAIDIVRAAISERARAVGRYAFGVRTERAFLNWRIAGRVAAWVIVGLSVSSVAWFTGNWFAEQGVRFPVWVHELAAVVMALAWLRFFIKWMQILRDRRGSSSRRVHGVAVAEALGWSVGALVYFTVSHSGDVAGVMAGAAGSSAETFGGLLLGSTGFFVLLGEVSRPQVVDESRLHELLTRSRPGAVLFAAEPKAHGSG